jgi:hypothetical protein
MAFTVVMAMLMLNLTVPVMLPLIACGLVILLTIALEDISG